MPKAVAHKTPKRAFRKLPSVVIRPDRSGFSIIVSRARAVRSEQGRDPKLTTHYSSKGEVVRFDIDDPVDEGYRLPAPIEENVYMSLTNAAERIDADPSTLRKAAARETLRTIRVGNEWLTTPAWLDDYARRRRRPGRPRKSA